MTLRLSFTCDVALGLDHEFGGYIDACKGVSGDREVLIRQCIHGDLARGLGVGFQSFDTFTGYTTAF
jgi:hypothetical protein